MGELPAWDKGQQRTCFRCGFWYGERDWRISKIDGKWTCTQCQDSLTEKQRQEQIRGMSR